MVRAYDTLVLADVYAVIAYYLRHRDEVRVYLKRRAEEAAALRAKIEAEHPRITREELLARRSLELAGRTEMTTFLRESREDLEAGRTVPAVEALERLVKKHKLKRKAK